MGSGHHRRQRLGAAHAAEPRGQYPATLEVAAIMLATHFGERLESALHDALGADVDPGSGRHLAVHHQALAIELAEMVPGRPFRNQVRIGDQDPRRILMGAEHADRLSRLYEQGLVAVEPAQRLDDPVVALPVARGAADAAIDDQLLGRLRDGRIEVVHQHPQRRLGRPASSADLGAGRRRDVAAVVASVQRVAIHHPVIARSEATKQSRKGTAAVRDCGARLATLSITLPRPQKSAAPARAGRPSNKARRDGRRARRKDRRPCRG